MLTRESFDVFQKWCLTAILANWTELTTAADLSIHFGITSLPNTSGSSSLLSIEMKEWPKFAWLIFSTESVAMFPWVISPVSQSPHRVLTVYLTIFAMTPSPCWRERRVVSTISIPTANYTLAWPRGYSFLPVWATFPTLIWHVNCPKTWQIWFNVSKAHWYPIVGRL